MRNLQEQVKKAFCYQKLFWPFTVWINCSSDLKNFANSRPSTSNFKSFSRSLEQFFLTVGQNNFGNKTPFLCTKLFQKRGTIQGWTLFKGGHYLRKYGTYLKTKRTKLLSYTCWISKTLNHDIGATIIEGFNTTWYPGVELEAIAGSPEKINKQKQI